MTIKLIDCYWYSRVGAFSELRHRRYQPHCLGGINKILIIRILQKRKKKHENIKCKRSRILGPVVRSWVKISGGSRRGPPAPLVLDQTEVRRAEKSFFGDRSTSPPHPISGSGWQGPPYLKVWMRHWIKPPPGLVWNLNSDVRTHKSKFFAQNLMTGYSKKNGENYPRECFW